MKSIHYKLASILIFLIAGISSSHAQIVTSYGLQSNPWENNQLIRPAVLAKMISTNQKMHIYNIGVVQDIKGAVHLGAASEKENLEKLAKQLKGLPKNETIIVYCGCCPMGKCPNIRPAFQLLKDQKFTKAFLLELPVNLKTDWISKGYPLNTETL